MPVTSRFTIRLRTSVLLAVAAAGLVSPASVRAEEMVLYQFTWDQGTSFVFEQKLRTSGSPSTVDWSNWFMASNRGYSSNDPGGTRLFVADTGGGVNEYHFDGTHFAFQATLTGGSPIDGDWTGCWQEQNAAFPGLQTFTSDGAGTFNQQVWNGVGFGVPSVNTMQLRTVESTSDLSNTEMWWAGGAPDFNHTGHQFFAIQNGAVNGTDASFDRYINGVGDGTEPDLFADYEDSFSTAGEPGDSDWDRGFGTFFSAGTKNQQLNCSRCHLSRN